MRGALRPGGVFLVADAMLADRGAWADDARAVWAAHLVAHGHTEAEARARFAAWALEDRYVPIADELASLRAVGFADVDVVWRRGPVAVIAATG